MFKENLVNCIGDIVFVADAFDSPISKLVYIGLEVARMEGYEKVLVPAIRTGSSFGKFEKTASETLQGLSKGIHDFMTDYCFSVQLKEINLVVLSKPINCWGLSS